ncbi:DNA topoisomerase 3-alpha [Portunus trituberculatus]|uniref:DNA topoisomerase 3-alpha n=1 Tax=Portunus trituberculatus TaxID=210409 RepID=A0A5B7J525_PORTR|nr:DNA topoisomerase 3-alpha [Portunus trituberculatus]
MAEVDQDMALEEAGQGQAVVEAGQGQTVGEAGQAQAVVEAGQGQAVVEAGQGQAVVEAGQRQVVVEDLDLRSSGYGSSWSTSGSGRHMDQENKIVCSCNKEAILLTAKNGPNTGRPFYRCADFQNSCNLFLWADDDNSIRRERDKDTGRGWNQTGQSSTRTTSKN